MKGISTGVAAIALAAIMAVGPANEAKADGGVIAIGVGAYLLSDAVVGRKCDRHEWPFNIIRKLADELHGRPGCHRHGYHHDDYHHRHHRPYK